MELSSLQTLLGATPKEIRQQRVRTFTTSAEASSRRVIEDLKAEIRNRETELMQSLDVSPTSATDLASRLSTVNSEEMVKHILQSRFDIKMLTMQLESYVETHNALFPKAVMDMNLYNEIEESTSTDQ